MNRLDIRLKRRKAFSPPLGGSRNIYVAEGGRKRTSYEMDGINLTKDSTSSIGLNFRLGGYYKKGHNKELDEL